MGGSWDCAIRFRELEKEYVEDSMAQYGGSRSGNERGRKAQKGFLDLSSLPT